MQIDISPEAHGKLTELARLRGEPVELVLNEAISGYLAGLEDVRTMLDRRFDDYKAGKAQLIDGPSFFENLRRREEQG